jgi:twitching motility protein PilJ
MSANTNPLDDQVKSGSFTTVLLVLAFVAMALNFGYGFYLGKFDERRSRDAGELRVLSQQITSYAAEAMKGSEPAFQNLNRSKSNFEQKFDALALGDPATGLQSAPLELKQQISTTADIWSRVGKAANVLLNAKSTVLELHEEADKLGVIVPQLQSSYSEVVNILLENNANANTIWYATRQSWYAERILASLQKVLTSSKEAQSSADNFGHDVDIFGQVLNGMLSGDTMMSLTAVRNSEARAALQDILRNYQDVKVTVDKIINSKDPLFEAHAANDVILAESGNLLKASDSLEKGFIEYPQKRLLGNTLVSGGLLALVAVLLLLMYLQQRGNQRKRTSITDNARKREQSQNERNQHAIIRLLDEMEGLADGDLTVNVTVTEDFTGAIADAMNFTVDQLRNLVATIKKAVVRVSSSAEETQNTATELAQASKNQAQEITGASAAINEMAVSIEQVSANASESTQVAEKSVEMANRGAAVVRNTIKGMDTIREQIQETSKRIKRLGESSQEIGDIVALINDISDQTNILALNAAIQASMAGEAGRGFAVVADEVQRLAERSGNATKQIEALVKTIQTDTNEAVISMEASTSEVVRGAQLAQDAGVALEEIENVSRDLADLIQNISNAARQQAASAGHVSNTMNVIQEITNQTLAGTQATAVSIGTMAELADDLSEGVSGFKLPDTENDEMVVDLDDETDEYVDETREY